MISFLTRKYDRTHVFLGKTGSKGSSVKGDRLRYCHPVVIKSTKSKDANAFVPMHP